MLVASVGGQGRGVLNPLSALAGAGCPIGVVPASQLASGPSGGEGLAGACRDDRRRLAGGGLEGFVASEHVLAGDADEQVVEALAADRADLPFGDRVRPWRPKRRLDHTNAFGANDRVQRTAELRVPIMGQEPHVPEPLVDCQVPNLLCHPGAVRVCGHPGEVTAPRAVLDPEQHVQRELVLRQSRRRTRVRASRWGPRSCPSQAAARPVSVRDGRRKARACSCVSRSGVRASGAGCRRG